MSILGTNPVPAYTSTPEAYRYSYENVTFYSHRESIPRIVFDQIIGHYTGKQTHPGIKNLEKAFEIVGVSSDVSENGKPTPTGGSHLFQR